MNRAMVAMWAWWVPVACVPSSRGGDAVVPGIGVLLRDSIHLVRDQRVGLLTNQTGVDASGVSDLTRLLDAGVQVTAIFSPEHGYRGLLDREVIADTTESTTGIQIFSLYGETRDPTPAMLALIDVLLVDLQDIGGRPYTYISTALRAAEAAAPAGVRVVILDRPNPLGGVIVQGPVRDAAVRHQMIGLLAVPQRHGMTLGELVLWGNAELGLGADVRVVPAGGWNRAQWFDETGLLWTRPSPSMPDLESATHYPGLVLFEATNLSVGRGTDVAFSVIGAPWLSTSLVRARLGVQPGVDIVDTTITPANPPDGKYGGQTIAALRFRVGDRSRYDPVATAVRVLDAIHVVHRDSLRVNERRLGQLMGTMDVWRAVSAGAGVESLIERWAERLRGFEERRAPFLIYE